MCVGLYMCVQMKHNHIYIYGSFDYIQFHRGRLIEGHDFYQTFQHSAI